MTYLKLICPKCNTKNNITDKFCLKCGRKLPESYYSQIADSKKQNESNSQVPFYDIEKKAKNKPRIQKFTKQKNKPPIPNPEIKQKNNVLENINPYIGVLFYESMPGRVSLGNTKNYIQGILEIADKEIIIHKKSLWRGKDRGKKHIRYDKISSIDYDTGKILATPSIQLCVSSIEYSFRSKNPQLELFYNKIREKIEQSHSPNDTKSNTDYLDELKKLAELRDLGIVTQEEFELKKKKLLDL